MSEKKVIYVKREQQLLITCLVDRGTNMGYFLVKDADGKTTIADEIVAGEIVFSADQRTRTVFKVDGTWLEKDVFDQCSPGHKKSCTEVVEIPIHAPLPTDELKN